MFFPLAKLALVPLVAPVDDSHARTASGYVVRRSSLLEPRKRHDMPCACIEAVDLDIFRGVFTDQWLHGETFGLREPQFFCTTCGPPAVQETLSDKDKKDEKKMKQSSSSNKLKKFFGISTAPKEKEKKEVATSMTKSTTSTGGAQSARISAEEEEVPVTPRTEKELFLCATCGACYCRDHAQDHQYSRRHPFTGDVDGTSLDKDYPYHSCFIGVPSYISTHPAHIMQETDWGLLFPTVLVKEVEERAVPKNKPIEFYTDFARMLDEIDPLRSATNSGPSSRLPSARVSYTALNDATGPANRNSRSTGRDTPTAITVPASSCILSPPTFSSVPPENWSYLMWCAKCNERPLRIAGKRYDDDASRQRHLRRLGQELALLSYFRRRGVRLELPQAYCDYMDRKQAQLEQQQREARTLSSAEVQRVSKSTEATPKGLETSSQGTAVISRGDGNGYGILSRPETDKVLMRAGICGYSNTGFYCYLNSVLQCVFRCAFFTRPLITLEPAKSPGRLTTSLCNLLHQLQRQTYQDVRNRAATPFVRAVYHQVCKICCLFEADEQQDAQEFLLSLLNGVADEFDRGKTAEEKKKMKRISFEGSMRTEVVCSNCHQSAPREEMFMSMSIPIEESIEEGLKSVFKPATLQGKDRYACEYCFRKMSEAEQKAHNQEAERQFDERRQYKQAGRKLPPELEKNVKMANCLYQDAEVNTSITRLGGTLAVHLLRFHYDPAVQDFIKVTTPVRISMKIDLSPYVSNDVLGLYAQERSRRALAQRFPAVDDKTREEFLRSSKYDYASATKRMVAEGHRGAGAASPGSAPTPPLAAAAAGAASSKGVSPPGAAVRTVNVEENGRATNVGSGKPPLSSTAAKEGGPLTPPRSPRRAADILPDNSFDAFGEHSNRVPSLVRQLVGIVTHRGSLHGGHYIAYIRNLAKPDVWFRCDDEDVDIVSEKTVLECSAEVYLAFYE